jgi:hypothetical protein
VAALSDTCGEMVASGGDSGHPGPIRLAGRKRTARRCSSAGRGSRGRRGAARVGSGRARLSAGVRGREKGSEPGREERKRGKWHGMQGSLQGGSSRH